MGKGWHCQAKSSHPTCPLPLPRGPKTGKLRGQGMMKKSFLPQLKLEEPESPEQAWFFTLLPY